MPAGPRGGLFAVVPARDHQALVQHERHARIGLRRLRQGGVAEHARGPDECGDEQPAGHHCEPLQLCLQLEGRQLRRGHCLLLVARGDALGQVGVDGTALGPLGVPFGHGDEHHAHAQAHDRQLHVPHAVPGRPLLHLQRDSERLQPRRRHRRVDAQARRATGGALGLCAGHADRAGRAQREPRRPQRPGAGEVHLGRHPGGADEAARVDGLGVPRHGDVAR
mmetsp:Transcript_56138/g.162691  ORF Transcript_56138/g.162691 Transcript_56138/m.162691 type:complete len:222 (-) Transcript_56138:897-1562(-)